MPQVPGTVYVPYKPKDHEIEELISYDEDEDGNEIDRVVEHCLYCGWEQVFDDDVDAYFAGKAHVKELSGRPNPERA